MDDHYQYSRPRPELICRSSVQLDQMLMLPSSADSDLDSVPPGSQLYQIKERAYMQRLQVFQEAQQRQAQLVQKLQTKVRTSGLCQDVMKSCDLASRAVFCFFFPFFHKVLQYKKRCGELEEQVLGKTSEAEKMRLTVGLFDGS